MTGRLVDIDALDRAMYHKSFEVDDGRTVWNSGLWIRYKIYEEASREAPTVEAVPVSFIEAEIKRMEDEIEHALIEYKHADGTVERMIARKAALEFTLEKWRAERKEE